jgi:signal transduction histidine kinase
LEAAIADLISFWQARQPDVEFVSEVAGVDQWVPEKLRDVIYRVVQESVANALKHAETRLVAITSKLEAGAIEFKIANRGSARAARPEHQGLGLTSMRERVNAAGGVLSIDRGSEGWTVVVRFEKHAIS